MPTLDEFTGKVILCAVTAVVALALDRLLSRITRRAVERFDMPNVSILVNIGRALVWTLAVLFIMKPVFGLDPMALVTTLGVISIVVSLGMQDTIANVIGGLGLMAGHVFEPGDVIEVAGTKGEVVDITWRCTTLRLADGSTEVIPNSVLNNTKLTRFAPRPAKRYTMNLQVRPDADLEAVAADIVSTANEALAGLVSEEWPTEVYFVGTDAFGVNVIVWLFLLQRKDDVRTADTLMRALAGRSWLVVQ